MEGPSPWPDSNIPHTRDVLGTRHMAGKGLIVLASVLRSLGRSYVFTSAVAWIIVLLPIYWIEVRFITHGSLKLFVAASLVVCLLLEKLRKAASRRSTERNSLPARLFVYASDAADGAACYLVIAYLTGELLTVKTILLWTAGWPFVYLTHRWVRRAGERYDRMA